MATFNINVNKRELIAVGDNYIVNVLDGSTELNVLANDILGIEPTNITFVDSTDFTLGSLSIVDNNIEFVPNDIIGTSQFQYTITDSELTTATTVVVITTI